MRRWWPLLSVLAGCGLVIDLEPRVTGTSDGSVEVDGSNRVDAGDASLRRDAGDAGDGSVPVACGVPLHIATAPAETAGTTAAPSLAWTGDGFGLVWHQEAFDLGVRQIHHARLDAEGAMVGGPFAITGAEGNGDYGELVWNGVRLALAWEDSSPGRASISFVQLATDGALLTDPIVVSQSTGTADRPDVAWDGSGYGVVWQDSRSGRARIFFRTIGAGGTLAGTEVPLSTLGIEARDARIASSGGRFAVAWDEARADGDHVVATTSSGPSTSDLSPAGDPDIAWTGVEWTIVYERSGGLAVAQGDETLGTIDSSGIPTAPSGGDEASIAWSGTDLGIAFEASNGGQIDIHFLAIDSAGAITRPVRVVGALATGSHTPTLAWAAEVGRFAVAWSEDAPEGEAAQEIYFAWICP